MSNIVIKFFKKYQLELHNKVLVIAVSTGLDSMVLLHEAIAASKIVDFKIVVAHVNHQLREQSHEEERFITDFCHRHQLSLQVKRLDESVITGNFHDVARKFRYQFFEDVILEYKADYLLLAHHANDNIETIMMRLLRGSNLRGYAGIEKIISRDNYLLIRPLLGVLKEDLVMIAHHNKIKYYEDESNYTNLYTRNRIRKDIVPSLFKENPQIHKQLEHFANVIKHADDEIKTLINKFINEHVIISEDIIEINRNALLHESVFLQKEILFTLTKKIFLGKKNIEEILKLINSNKPNIISQITSKLTFVREYDKILFYFKPIEVQEVSIEITKCGEFQIDEKRKVVVSKKNTKNTLKNNSLWYNKSMLPILIRSRKDGDKIELKSGTKKISDFLIDKKIGILQRQQILIVEDKNSNILAVLGVAKSKHLKNQEADLIITLKEKD